MHIVVILIIVIISLFVINLIKNIKTESIPQLVWKGKGLIIYKNFFPNSDFEKILGLTNPIKLEMDKRVISRITKCIDRRSNSMIYDLIYKNDYLAELGKVMLKNPVKYPDFPIEYRKYPTGSDGMGWHSDVAMFSKHSMECVLTLKNTSDSKFYWKDDGIIRSIETVPNMVVIVMTDSEEHMVSKVNYGERKILKFVLHEKGDSHTEVYDYQLRKCP